MTIAWPPQGMLDYFGLSRAEAVEPLMVIGTTFAERLGFRCEWEISGDAVRIRYSRA